MARRNEPVDVPEVDALPGLPLPHEQDQVIGHARAEAVLLNAYRSERLHHAWILGGPKGIGKATLAFRFAKFVISHPDRFSGDVLAAQSLDVPGDHPVARQVRAGGHPNILHLRRPWDEKNKRFKADLPVDEVRRTVSFFGTTASAGAWRVCIVDAADDMNASSANALLKILEEPPERCIFLVLSHAPGRLLPTIRSRCRCLDMDALTAEDIKNGIRQLAPQAPEDERALQQISAAADGSLRSAFMLLAGDGLTIASGVQALADAGPAADLGKVHALADLVAARGQTDNWESFQHLVANWLHVKMRGHVGAGISESYRYVRIWDDMRTLFAETDALNLDRKQAVLDFFLKLRQT
ncbi:DNA polymerase III subunit delta' [Roseibium denhamense]|uniref:DNA polymerase III, delta prime subunit n=1 Tax=Roseibium denhamense TaxID=76305 RepID=A0ABY1PEL0_9HYPH|nr:DNA polymerase III subunit delta' [Roseibium denhamense]MTI07841.1 DNA polymerase III subunit delta' [Roseibium denhamense]SMP31728.1 DNA polymerase III, delta prime subunit [Roseibium denhamense]